MVRSFSDPDVLEMFYRRIAQLVEHRSPKPGAVGSSPSSPANIKALASAGAFYVCG